MNRGILFASLAALAWSPLGSGCRTPAGPEQVKAVENLITRVEAAHLTLNELDRGRYGRAEAVFRSEADRFTARFQDTLDPATAEAMVTHFRVLRAAGSMGESHDLLVERLADDRERLRHLHADLLSGAIGAEEAREIIAREAQRVDALDPPVQAVIANYKAVQRTWDELPRIDSLLATQSRTIPQP